MRASSEDHAMSDLSRIIRGEDLDPTLRRRLTELKDALPEAGTLSEVGQALADARLIPKDDVCPT